MSKRVTFKVSFDLPEDCGANYAKETLENHLSCMGGDLRPHGWDGPDSEGDPMFYLDRGTIKVTRARQS